MEEQTFTGIGTAPDLKERKWYDWPWWSRALYIIWVPWLFVFIIWFGQETIVMLGSLWAWIETWSWNLGDVFVYAMIIAALVSLIMGWLIITWRSAHVQ